ncbi:hypothetical protein HUN13_01010 [Acinetobacter seifertii]|uniref:hypothetical protein n=1 Tax=Acinetobacter seifertii TaxID=1530123 RepID=UPI00158026AD|nr:hypothetical protein [Acinetobacter seifertii]NUG10162.1 hypothetical protein [Acinetobacter seifertii]
MNELKLPSFKKPVSKEEAVSVFAHWQYGDSITFVASYSGISVKKVSEIVDYFPKEWRPDVDKYSKGWR